MNTLAITGPQLPPAADTLLLGIFNSVDSVLWDGLTMDEKSRLQELLTAQPKLAKYGELSLQHTFGAFPAKRLLLLGLGDAAELTADKLCGAIGTALRSAGKGESTEVLIAASSLKTAALSWQQLGQAVAEGAILGTYRFTSYKSEAATPLPAAKLLAPDETAAAQLAAGTQTGQITAGATALARDLVNHPSCHMTPRQMAENARQIVSSTSNLELTILDEAALKEAGLSAMLSVAQGSEEPPCLISIAYNGDENSSEITAFIGKGITFDSGGISLKPAANMGEMKNDMSGGAAVLGAMQAISRLCPKINVLALIPCAENMPSGRSYRPGDVISSLSGQTIEIISTDAEGRLLLADAITYAKQQGAVRLIDIATLTGACVVALGTMVSGVIANDQKLCDEVLAAAAAAGEKMWQLPNLPEYKELNKSDIADIKNSGGRMGGAITAGLFLEHFAGDTPWVHLDIAGTATSEKEQGYTVKGATGAGTRTLIQLAKELSADVC